ncbi:MAG: hypothetical protein WEC59_13120 [Salibacteraceae bacterium]
MLFVFLLIMVSTRFVSAQDSIDTISIPQKPKVSLLSNAVFQFDNRSERYYNMRGRMNGLKLGVEFYKRFRVGLGIYANNDFYRIEPAQGSDSLFRTARFSYVTAFTEMVVFRNYYWDVSLIGSYGSGNIAANTFDNLSAIPSFVRLDTFADVHVFDLGFTAYFKMFPWLGIGAGAGSRSLRNLNDQNLFDAFNNPYFEFKLKVYLGYAYRSIFKPESILEEKMYYDYRKKKRIEYLKSKFNP